MSIDSSKQLLSRAKKALKEQCAHLNLHSAYSKDLLSKYVEVIRNGDVNMLEEMLSDHITSHTDGGGKIKVLSEFTSGIKAVTQWAVRVFTLYLRRCRIEFK